VTRATLVGMEDRTTPPGDDALVLALVAAWARAQAPTSAEQVRALADSRRVRAVPDRPRRRTA